MIPAGVLVPAPQCAALLHLVRQSAGVVPAELQPLLGELAQAAAQVEATRIRRGTEVAEVERLRAELVVRRRHQLLPVPEVGRDWPVSRVASSLGVTARRVRQLLAAGRLTGSQDHRGDWWVHPASVDDYRRTYGRERAA